MVLFTQLGQVLPGLIQLGSQIGGRVFININPVGFGVGIFTFSVQAAQALNHGSPWGQIGHQEAGGKIDPRFDYLGADDYPATCGHR